MPWTKPQRRLHRQQILEALQSETGSWGGDLAAPRVQAYCLDPVGATTLEYSYVGSLILRRFYIDPDKPDAAERASLWTEITERTQIQAADPGGWDGNTDVLTLQMLIEEATP